MSDPELLRTDVVVIGSGAGGAITAATLAEGGRGVLVVEEGPAAGRLERHSPEAMRRLYRNAGLSPILGRTPVAFVEGRCVGGSTEINSLFWHRPPDEAIERWARRYQIEDLTPLSLREDVEALEAELRPVRCAPGSPPISSAVFGQGLRRSGLTVSETARVQAGDPGRSQFAAGARRSMSATVLPRAERAGATIVSGFRARRLRLAGDRVTSVALTSADPGPRRRLTVQADHVIVCGGAIQTPALLRASGIKRRVGDALHIHPMVKVAATFDDQLDAHESVMPVYQLRDPRSGHFLGGSVFTPGFLGMTLGERWPANESALADWRRMALFYAACRGSGAGSVRAFPGTGDAIPRYIVSADDGRNLSQGLSSLCSVLLAAGARRVYPGVRDAPPIESPDDVIALCGEHGDALSIARMAISTVHVTSSCPMGEDQTRCAVDSYGRVRGVANLRLADASIIPDAPGVNPQATVMALARRNARQFLASGDGA